MKKETIDKLDLLELELLFIKKRPLRDWRKARVEDICNTYIYIQQSIYIQKGLQISKITKWKHWA